MIPKVDATLSAVAFLTAIFMYSEDSDDAVLRALADAGIDLADPQHSGFLIAGLHNLSVMMVRQICRFSGETPEQVLQKLAQVTLMYKEE